MLYFTNILSRNFATIEFHYATGKCLFIDEENSCGIQFDCWDPEGNSVGI